MARPSRQTPPTDQTLDDVLHLIGNPKWDLFMVGDGSGSGWGSACGWSAILIARHNTSARRIFYGGMDNGSINFAESMPYMQALSWYDHHYGKAQLQKLKSLRVVILTDSQVVATWGASAMQDPIVASKVPRSQYGLWSMFRSYRDLGYQFDFRWAGRMTTQLNWAADLVAGLSRRAVMDGATQRQLELPAFATADELGRLSPTTANGDMLDIYECNPRHRR